MTAENPAAAMRAYSKGKSVEFTTGSTQKEIRNLFCTQGDPAEFAAFRQVQRIRTRNRCIFNAAITISGWVNNVTSPVMKELCELKIALCVKLQMFA
jgi:hypothetical protein